MKNSRGRESGDIDRCEGTGFLLPTPGPCPPTPAYALFSFA